MVEPAEPTVSTERYRLLVENVTDYAIFMVSPDGRVADWNVGAERVFGYREEEIVDRHFSSLFAPEDIRRAVPDRELEQAVFEERGEDERWHVRKDGTRFWASGFLKPVRDEDGNLRGFVKVARDITERKRAEDSLRILAEAGELMASPLDYRARLRDLARLVVPNLADWCAIDVIREDGSLERVAVEHEDPQKIALARQLWERYPDDPDSLYGVPNVFRTGEPEMMSEIPEELLDQAARDAEHGEMLRALDLGSYMIVPMIARGRTLGAISFVVGKSRRGYDTRDLSVAETLVRRASLGVDNARLYQESQKEIAERRRAEKELRRSRDELEVILGGVADGITVQDPSGHLLYANEVAARMVGYPSAREFVEAPLQDVMHRFEVMDENGDPFPLERLPGRRVLRGEDDVGEEVLRFRVAKTGEERWSVLKAAPVLREDGRIRMAVNIFRDITEHHQAVEKLRQSEEEYRTIFRLAGVGKSQADPETGRLLRVNPKLCEITGYSEEELLGMTSWDLTHPEDREQALTRFRRMISGERPEYSVEKRYVRKDGRVVWVNVNATVSRDADGRPLRTVAMIQDITERKQAEETVRESEERFRSAFEYAPIGMSLVRLEDGRWLKANRVLCDILGYPERELLSMTFQDVTHPDDLDQDIEQMQRLLAKEIPSYQLEKRYVRKDGRVVWCLLSASLVRDANGDPLYGIAQVEDVTARKQAEEELAQSEDRLRTIVETEPECVKVLDMDGCVLEMNPAGLALVEADSLEQVRGKPVYDVVLPKYRAEYKALTERVLRGGSGTLEFESVGLKGTHFWLETHAVALRDARGDISGLLGITRDITERKKAEEALRQSERLWRTVIEQAQENICLVDSDTGRILEVNPAFRETLGYSTDELRHMTLYDLVAHDQDSVERNMRKVMKHKRYFIGQRKYRRKDGSLLDVEVSASTIVREARKIFCVVAHDVTERARVQELLEERLGLLSDVAANLVLQRPIGDTLDIMAKSVVKASTSVACSVVLNDQGADAPKMVGSYGLPEEYASSLQAAYRAGVRSPTMEVFRTRHPALVRDVHRLILSDPLYSSVHHLIREAKWDPVYVVPLVSRQRTLGAINFYYPHGQEPAEEEKLFLKAVAYQTAVAIENARLLSEAQDKAALEERQKLARELHDSVSQALYGIALGAETARELLEEDPKQAAEPLDYVLSLNEAGIAEMRALIFELRPESLEEEGLIAALAKQVASLEARHKLKIETTLCDEPDASTEVKEAIYRISQEALNNVVKHAGASNVQIKVEFGTVEIILEISDDGIGFNPKGDFRGHLGLRSMRERALKLGGTLEVDSVPGKGTEVRAQIPLYPSSRTD